MSASREKDQSDFDLERFVDMFDEAMTSSDPRVMRALRDLMMMVTLTRPESPDTGPVDRQRGPLRRLFEDMNHLHRRLERLEEEHRQLESRLVRKHYDEQYKYPYEKFATKAAAEMEAQIDQDVLSKILAQNAAQINSKGLHK